MFPILIAVGWLYVALMMAVAEATNTTGTVLGALITFVLYGVGPVALVLYLIGAPGRRHARKMREAAELAAWRAAQQPTPPEANAQEADSGQPDAGGHAPADAVAPVRKEP
ncbi:MAG: hypothetical protein HY068_12170 [Burkholderiales bacterium]|nr:hypothetical protein [Burkholderiales bacterium]